MTAYTIVDGVFHVDGVPQALVSADYPYYRDDPSHWEGRLTALRDECGVRIVTFYIPWRHHQPALGGDYDFTGRTQPNRDVLGFIATVARLGMLAVAKPGPFIHAETNFGSLPDALSPTLNPAIEAWQDAAGRPNTWSSAVRDAEGFISGMELALPAPFDPLFLGHTRQWLSAVGEQVIRPQQHPHGPIILVQIANEGVYSDGQAPVWEFDYSPSTIERYRAWLAAEYPHMDAYNASHGTEYDDWGQVEPPRTFPQGLPTPQQNADYRDWGRFAAHFLGEVYREWLAALRADVPVVINLNPPVNDAYGTDAWLARVEPERYPFVHYGFTNWIGDVSADPSAFDRYLLTAKRVRGINFEENWSFSKLYDASYIEPATPFFQTLLALAGGAAGYNIYTGVNTAHWDDHLDALHERPYPDASPIREDGSASYKATIARWLNAFLEDHGSAFVQARLWQPVALGIVQAHCYASMWDELPLHGMAVNTFQRLMHENGCDYGILSLDHASPEALAAYPLLVVNDGDLLSEAIQARLAAYAAQGGRVYLLGSRRYPWALPAASLRDVLPALARYPRPRLQEGSGTAWVRTTGDTLFAIVLLPKGDDTQAVFRVPWEGAEHTLAVQAAPGAGAIMAVQRGRIVGAVCKGVNDWVRRRVEPLVRWDDHTIGAPAACDLAWRRGLLHTAVPPENFA